LAYNPNVVNEEPPSSSAAALAAASSAALIVGCGYLGRRLAQRLLEDGRCVYGTTRSLQKARRLAELGVRPLIVEVTQPVTLAALTPALEAASLDVYHLVPPGREGV